MYKDKKTKKAMPFTRYKLLAWLCALTFLLLPVQTFSLGIQTVWATESSSGQKAATLEDLIKARQSGDQKASPPSTAPQEKSELSSPSESVVPVETLQPSESTAEEPLKIEEAKPVTTGENLKSVASLKVTPRDWDMVFTESLVYSKNFVAASINDKNDFVFLLSKNKSETLRLGNYQSLLIAFVAYPVLKNRLDETYILRAEDIPEVEDKIDLSGLPAGATLTIKDLFYLLLMHQSFDAAEALAKLSYGSRSGFVSEASNVFAKMGLANTKLAALHDTDKQPSFTTVEDLAYFMTSFLQEEFLRQVLSEKNYTFNYLSENSSKSYTARSNYFDMIKSTTFRGQSHIQGGVANWSQSAGYSLLTFAPLGNGYVIAISARAADNYFRLLDHTGFYASGFNRTHSPVLYKKGELLGSITVEGSLIKKVDFYMDEDVKVKVPEIVGPKQITQLLQLEEWIKAPQDAGEKVGSLQITYGEEELYQKELRLQEPITLYPLYKLNQSLFALYFKNSALHYLVMIVFILLLGVGIVLFNYLTRDVLKQKR